MSAVPATKPTWPRAHGSGRSEDPAIASSSGPLAATTSRCSCHLDKGSASEYMVYRPWLC
eukprot:scaffold10789_cov141-Isochrysis_galbana.AAC.3